jgi:hypothetical protein
MFLLAVFAFHKPKERPAHSQKPPTRPKSIIGPKVREPAKPDDPVAEERVFTRLTASELRAFFDDKTSVQAGVLAAPHMNKWMSVRGTVREVTLYKDGEVSVALSEGKASIAARFVGEEAKKAVHFTKGSDVSIVGRIGAIDMNLMWLNECEVI